MRLVAYDSETHLIQPGLLAPPMVCASVAELGQRGRLLTKSQALVELRRLLEDPDVLLVLANAPFDFAVAAVAEPSLLPLIFAAYRANRVHDILVAQALDAIAKGILLKEKNGTPLLSSKGTQTDRYSLDICTRLNFGRTDAKVNDFWRMRYAILEHLPFELWPEEARQYPVDDVENTVLNAAHQLGIDRSGQPFNEKHLKQKHAKLRALFAGATTEGERAAAAEAMRRVQERLEAAVMQGLREPFENLQDLPAQVFTDWALHLGAVWGLRSDESRIDLLETRALELHAEYVERFTKVGFFREAREEFLPGGAKDDHEDPDAGKKNTCAVARAVAAAYGATGDCVRCQGTGRVRPLKAAPCKGVKVKNRFQGCTGPECTVCGGLGEVHKAGDEVICRQCVGCGFDDFSTVPLTDGGKTGVRRVATDRDTLAESGDDTLVEFAENKHEKALKTYVPYLRRGGARPITLEPNVLVESGRTSYRGVIQLFPRGSLGVTADGRWVPTARECFVARPGRVFGSTDYPAGELCTLAQVCWWVVGFSRMAGIINEDGKPGSLHGVFAAKMTGDTPEAFLAKVRAKDKKAKTYRQTAKPCNFGLPGGMGSPKFVLTNRKENAGTTEAPNGRKYPGIRFCVSVGDAYECGTQKLRQWGRPGHEYEIPPTCKACLELVEHELKPLWFDTFPEVRRYHAWVKQQLEAANYVVPCFGPWFPNRQAPHRMRNVSGADSSFCAAANNGFQAFIADITKTALRKCVIEAYTDESSVLYQAKARFICFQHDELFWECDEAFGHLVGDRVSDIMHEAYNEWVPDVQIEGVDSALMRYWNKDAESIYEVSFDQAPDTMIAAVLREELKWPDDKASAAVRYRRATFESRADARLLASRVRGVGGKATDPRLLIWEPKAA